MINLGRTILRLSLLLILYAISTAVFAQAQRVEVQLSSQRVNLDDSVILNVRAYGLDSEIDPSALNAEFDVTKRSSSRQVTIENGKRTSLVEWVLELIPKRAGTLEIPPIIVGTEQSRPLTLLVEAPATGAARDLFLEASVDVNEPYVQAQVIYTLRVFQGVRLLDASLQVPEVDEVVMQQLTDESKYQQVVNGRTYNVSELRYSVFPQQSGSVKIPSLALQAVIQVNPQQQANSRTRTKRVTRRSEEIDLKVQARPDDMLSSWWLPAKEVVLQSEWSTPVDQLQVDQPVTRTVTVMATGVADAQLPELDIPEVQNLSVYADSPTSATNASDRGLISQQTNTWAVIPQVAGSLVLPEIRVNWFDTELGEARTAVLPEETLNVIGTSSASNNNQNTPSTNLTQTDSSASQTTVSTDDSDALADLNQATEESAPTESSTAALSATNSPALQPTASQWRNVAIALLAGWLLSLLGIWFWWRKKLSGQTSNKDMKTQQAETDSMRFRRRAGSNAALASVKTACDTADPSKISKEVLSWAAMVWPGAAPTNLPDVAQRLNSQSLAQAFEALDAQQFRPSGSVKPVAVETIPELLRKAVDGYQDKAPNSPNSKALPSL